MNTRFWMERLTKSASRHIISPTHRNNLKLLKSKSDLPCTDGGGGDLQLGAEPLPAPGSYFPNAFLI